VVGSVVTGEQMWPTFESGHHITQIVDACLDSSRLRQWVSIA
ncbi:MAG: gfo/Idh/MocA family oxidoreductase, partial [Mesorhizobium sp.]